jgi:hypothetical protein
MPATSEAKEHAAACAEIPSFIVRMRATVEAAMFQRNRGSSLAAYQILRSTSASLAREATRADCGALGGTLTAALRRSAVTGTALEAGAELDLGLETAMALAINGRPPLLSSPAKLPPVAESQVYGAGCPDLFQIILRLDGPPEGLAARVRTVMVDLRDRPRCVRLRALLEAAEPGRLSHVVDSVRLDEPDAAPDEGAASNPLARCPEFPIVYERLATAISIGAPRYNSGDADGCRQTYEETARVLTREVIGAERCPVVRDLLAAGLSGAAAAPNASDAAWALRRSFDAVLEGPTGRATTPAAPESSSPTAP